MDREQTVDALFGARGEVLWATQIGSDGFDLGRAITIDGNNDLVVTGNFMDSISLAPEVTLTSTGSSDLYVLKLDSLRGEVVWGRRFGGLDTDRAESTAVDEANNIYVAGVINSSVDFGNGPVQITAPVATFVLKLRPDGALDWVRTFEGQRFTFVNVAVHGDTVVVAGSFGFSMTADASTRTSAGSEDTFVLKLSASNGATSWFKTFGGQNYDVVRGVGVDSLGNVVIAGVFSGSVAFDVNVNPITTAGDENAFVVKLAGADGRQLFAKSLGGPMLDWARALAVDSQNNVLITGTFTGTADFGCANMITSSQSTSAVFLAKYTQAGACLWVKGFDGTGYPQDGTAIASNSADEVAVSGRFCGSLLLGGTPLSSASPCQSSDMFAARFSSDGMHISSTRAGGPRDEVGHGVAESSDGRLFTTGEFHGFTEFGQHTFMASGSGSDGFIAAFAPF